MVKCRVTLTQIFRRTFQSKHILPSFARVITFVFIFTNIAFAHQPQSSVWESRRKEFQMASLPAQLDPMGKNPSASSLERTLFKQLPSIQSALKRKESSEPSLKMAPASAIHSDIPQTFFAQMTFRDAHKGKAGPTVLIIEDVHQNEEAQTHISEALKILGNIPGRGALLVGLESANGGFIYDSYKKLPNRELATQVADSFLKTGDLSGPAHAGFTSYYKEGTRGLFFWGVDDAVLYRRNVQAYKDSSRLKKKTLAKVKSLKKSLEREKKAVFDGELKKFDELVEAHRQGQVSLGEYVKKLSELNSGSSPLVGEGREGGLMTSSLKTRNARTHDLRNGAVSPSPYPLPQGEGNKFPVSLSFTLEQFLTAYEMESNLDFNKVDLERRTVLEKLARVMGQDDLKDLLSLSVGYQKGEVSFAQYYRHLRGLCGKFGIDLSKSRHFDDYIRYVLLADGIKAEKLFEDVQHLEHQIYGSLSKNKAQKDLIAQSRQLYLISQLVNFSLTSDQWEAYQNGRDALKHGLDLSAFEDFYVSADKRNEAMIQNLLEANSSPLVGEGREGGLITSSLKTRNADNRYLRNGILSPSPYPLPQGEGNNLSVLVSGGFHTRGMTELLKKKGLSYIVATPKLTKVDATSATSYLSVFDREKTPIEQLFTGQKLFLAAAQAGRSPAFAPELPDAAAEQVSTYVAREVLDQRNINSQTANAVNEMGLPEPVSSVPQGKGRVRVNYSNNRSVIYSDGTSRPSPRWSRVSDRDVAGRRIVTWGDRADRIRRILGFVIMGSIVAVIGKGILQWLGVIATPQATGWIVQQASLGITPLLIVILLAAILFAFPQGGEQGGPYRKFVIYLNYGGTDVAEEDRVRDAQSVIHLTAQSAGTRIRIIEATKETKDRVLIILTTPIILPWPRFAELLEEIPFHYGIAASFNHFEVPTPELGSQEEGGGFKANVLGWLLIGGSLLEVAQRIFGSGAGLQAQASLGITFLLIAILVGALFATPQGTGPTQTAVPHAASSPVVIVLKITNTPHLDLFEVRKFFVSRRGHGFRFDLDSRADGADQILTITVHSPLDPGETPEFFARAYAHIFTGFYKTYVGIESTNSGSAGATGQGNATVSPAIIISLILIGLPLILGLAYAASVLWPPAPSLQFLNQASMGGGLIFLVAAAALALGKLAWVSTTGSDNMPVTVAFENGGANPRTMARLAKEKFFEQLRTYSGKFAFLGREWRDAKAEAAIRAVAERQSWDAAAQTAWANRAHGVDRLGWVNALDELLANPERLEQVEAEARRMRDEFKFKYVIFCGMGGSTAAIKVLNQALKNKAKNAPQIYVLDSTDPGQMQDVVAQITRNEKGDLEAALEATKIVAISKSAGTEETIAQLNYWENLFSKNGFTYAAREKHFLLMTDPDSKEKFRSKSVFQGKLGYVPYDTTPIQLDNDNDIGGRFTAPATRVFLLPLALKGYNLEDYLKNVRDQFLVEDLKSKQRFWPNEQDDPYVQLGAYLHAQVNEERHDKVTMVLPDDISELGVWTEQLLDESLGKDGKGFTVLHGERLDVSHIRPKHENDRVFIHVVIPGVPDRHAHLMEQLKKGGYPVVTIRIPSAESLGAYMYGMQRMVATYAYLDETNPVNQPGVEQYKKKTREVRGQGQAVNFPENTFKTTDGKVTVYDGAFLDSPAGQKTMTGPALSKAIGAAGGEQSVPGHALATLLHETLGPDSYVDFRLYGHLSRPPDEKERRRHPHTKFAEAVREGLRRLGSITKNGTKFGIAPAILHSDEQRVMEGRRHQPVVIHLVPENRADVSDFDPNFIKAQALGAMAAEQAAGVRAILITVPGLDEDGFRAINKLFRDTNNHLQRLRPMVVEVPEADRRNEIKTGTAGWRAGYLFNPKEADKVPTGMDIGVTTHNMGRLAQSLADTIIARNQQKEPVAVGYDARPSGREFAVRVVEVLTANGIHADLIEGVTSTPDMIAATRPGQPKEQRYAYAVHITASHNEILMNLGPDVAWQGVKIAENGVPAGDATWKEISTRANNPATNGTYRRIPFHLIPRTLTTKGVNLVKRSQDRHEDVFDKPQADQRIEVVVDSMGGGTIGAASILSKYADVVAHLGIKPIFEELEERRTVEANGKTQRWAPDPTRSWNHDPQLKRHKEKATHQFDTGGKRRLTFIFDGDGDRVVIIDADGKTELQPNDLCLIFAHWLITHGETGQIVRTMPTTGNLDLLAQINGLDVIETLVGSKYFADYMDGLLLAGEESGHVFLKRKGQVFADSSVAQALLAIEILSQSGAKSLSEYRDTVYQEIRERLGREPLNNRRTSLAPEAIGLTAQNSERVLLDLKENRAGEFAQKLATALGKESDGFNKQDRGVLVWLKDGTRAMFRVSGTDGSLRRYTEVELAAGPETATRHDAMDNAIKDVLADMLKSAPKGDAPAPADPVKSAPSKNGSAFTLNVPVAVPRGQLEAMRDLLNELRERVRNEMRRVEEQDTERFGHLAEQARGMHQPIRDQLRGHGKEAQALLDQIQALGEELAHQVASLTHVKHSPAGVSAHVFGGGILKLLDQIEAALLGLSVLESDIPKSEKALRDAQRLEAILNHAIHVASLIDRWDHSNEFGRNREFAAGISPLAHQLAGHARALLPGGPTGLIKLPPAAEVKTDTKSIEGARGGETSTAVSAPAASPRGEVSYAFPALVSVLVQLADQIDDLRQVAFENATAIDASVELLNDNLTRVVQTGRDIQNRFGQLLQGSLSRQVRETLESHNASYNRVLAYLNVIETIVQDVEQRVNAQTSQEKKSPSVVILALVPEDKEIRGRLAGALRSFASSSDSIPRLLRHLAHNLGNDGPDGGGSTADLPPPPPNRGPGATDTGEKGERRSPAADIMYRLEGDDVVLVTAPEPDASAHALVQIGPIAVELAVGLSGLPGPQASAVYRSAVRHLLRTARPATPAQQPAVDDELTHFLTARDAREKELSEGPQLGPIDLLVQAERGEQPAEGSQDRSMSNRVVLALLTWVPFVLLVVLDARLWGLTAEMRWAFALAQIVILPLIVLTGFFTVVFLYQFLYITAAKLGGTPFHGLIPEADPKISKIPTLSNAQGPVASVKAVERKNAKGQIEVVNEIHVNAVLMEKLSPAQQRSAMAEERRHMGYQAARGIKPGAERTTLSRLWEEFYVNTFMWIYEFVTQKAKPSEFITGHDRRVDLSDYIMAATLDVDISRYRKDDSDRLMSAASILLDVAKRSGRIQDFRVINYGNDLQFYLTYSESQTDQRGLIELIKDVTAQALYFLDSGYPTVDLLRFSHIVEGRSLSERELLSRHLSAAREIYNQLSPRINQLPFQERGSEPIVVAKAVSGGLGFFNRALFNLYFHSDRTSGRRIEGTGFVAVVERLEDIQAGKQNRTAYVFGEQPDDDRPIVLIRPNSDEPIVTNKQSIRSVDEMMVLVTDASEWVITGVYAAKGRVRDSSTSYEPVATVTTEHLEKYDGIPGEASPSLIVRSQSGAPAVGEIHEALSYLYFAPAGKNGGYHKALYPSTIAEAGLPAPAGSVRVAAWAYQSYRKGRIPKGAPGDPNGDIVDLFAQRPDETKFLQKEAAELAEQFQSMGEFQPYLTAKEAERRAHEVAKRHAALFQNVPDPKEGQQDGYVVRANQAAGGRTFSVIKADAGGRVGHTTPPSYFHDVARISLGNAEADRLLNGGYEHIVGDDFHLDMTHTHGADAEPVHTLAWVTFMRMVWVAKVLGHKWYGLAQDFPNMRGRDVTDDAKLDAAFMEKLLALDAFNDREKEKLRQAFEGQTQVTGESPFSGNVQGQGPGLAELPLMVAPGQKEVRVAKLAMDKAGPAAFNFPIFKTIEAAHAGGRLKKGAIFEIWDVEHHRRIFLDFETQKETIQGLLGAVNKYNVKRVWERGKDFRLLGAANAALAVGERVLISASTEKLSVITGGEYLGKDDPVLLAVEELGNDLFDVAFTYLYMTQGDERGSNNMNPDPTGLENAVATTRSRGVQVGLWYTIHVETNQIVKREDVFARPEYAEVRRRVDKFNRSMWTANGQWTPIGVGRNDVESSYPLAKTYDQITAKDSPNGVATYSSLHRNMGLWSWGDWTQYWLRRFKMMFTTGLRDVKETPRDVTAYNQRVQEIKKKLKDDEKKLSVATVFNLNIGSHMTDPAAAIPEEALQAARENLDYFVNHNVIKGYRVQASGQDLVVQIVTHGQGQVLPKDVARIAIAAALQKMHGKGLLKPDSPRFSPADDLFQDLNARITQMPFVERNSEPIVVAKAQNAGLGFFNRALFNLFFHSDRTSGRRIEGTGFIAVVQKLDDIRSGKKNREGYVFGVRPSNLNEPLVLRRPNSKEPMVVDPRNIGSVDQMMALVTDHSEWVITEIYATKGRFSEKESAHEPVATVGVDHMSDGKLYVSANPVIMVRSQSGAPAIGEIQEALSYTWVAPGGKEGGHHVVAYPVTWNEMKNSYYQGSNVAPVAAYMYQSYNNGALPRDPDVVDMFAQKPHETEFRQAEAQYLADEISSMGEFQPHLTAGYAEEGARIAAAMRKHTFTPVPKDPKEDEFLKKAFELAGGRTYSVIKADAGGRVGHTTPPSYFLTIAKLCLEMARNSGLIMSHLGEFLHAVGDDLHLDMVHNKGGENPEVHSLAWETFMRMGWVAKIFGHQWYGLMQDFPNMRGRDITADAKLTQAFIDRLLELPFTEEIRDEIREKFAQGAQVQGDSPFSGNVQGQGPGLAELPLPKEGKARIAKIAMDKAGPAAFNIPIYEAVRMAYEAGDLPNGAVFELWDVANHTRVFLDFVEEGHSIQALLSAPNVYNVKRVWERDEKPWDYKAEKNSMITSRILLSASTEKLAVITGGEYLGKDDPVLLAVEELGKHLFEFAKTRVYLTQGDERGSNYMHPIPLALQHAVATIRSRGVQIGLWLDIDENNNVTATDVYASPDFDPIRERSHRFNRTLWTAQGQWTPVGVGAHDVESSYPLAKTLEALTSPTSKVRMALPETNWGMAARSLTNRLQLLGFFGFFFGVALIFAFVPDLNAAFRVAGAILGIISGFYVLKFFRQWWQVRQAYLHVKFSGLEHMVEDGRVAWVDENGEIQRSRLFIHLSEAAQRSINEEEGRHRRSQIENGYLVYNNATDKFERTDTGRNRGFLSLFVEELKVNVGDPFLEALGWKQSIQGFEPQRIGPEEVLDSVEMKLHDLVGRISRSRSRVAARKALLAGYSNQLTVFAQDIERFTAGLPNNQVRRQLANVTRQLLELAGITPPRDLNDTDAWLQWSIHGTIERVEKARLDLVYASRSNGVHQRGDVRRFPVPAELNGAVPHRDAALQAHREDAPGINGTIDGYEEPEVAAARVPSPVPARLQGIFWPLSWIEEQLHIKVIDRIVRQVIDLADDVTNFSIDYKLHRPERFKNGSFYLDVPFVEKNPTSWETFFITSAPFAFWLLSALVTLGAASLFIFNAGSLATNVGVYGAVMTGLLAVLSLPGLIMVFFHIANAKDNDSDLRRAAYVVQQRLFGWLLPRLPANVDVIAQRTRENEGSYTGQSSVKQALESGATGVLIGHSEARKHFGDSSHVKKQLDAAYAADAKTIIYALGEPKAYRPESDTFGVKARQYVSQQMADEIRHLTAEQVKRLIIAYEPLWSIKGEDFVRAATPADAQIMAEHIRSTIRGWFGADVADSVRILYGGSVSGDTAESFLNQADVDGLLVGTASAKFDEYEKIAHKMAEIAPKKPRRLYFGANWKALPFEDIDSRAYRRFARITNRFKNGPIDIGVAPRTDNLQSAVQTFTHRLDRTRSWASWFLRLTIERPWGSRVNSPLNTREARGSATVAAERQARPQSRAQARQQATERRANPSVNRPVRPARTQTVNQTNTASSARHQTALLTPEQLAAQIVELEQLLARERETKEDLSAQIADVLAAVAPRGAVGLNNLVRDLHARVAQEPSQAQRLRGLAFSLYGAALVSHGESYNTPAEAYRAAQQQATHSVAVVPVNEPGLLDENLGALESMVKSGRVQELVVAVHGEDEETRRRVRVMVERILAGYKGAVAVVDVTPDFQNEEGLYDYERILEEARYGDMYGVKALLKGEGGVRLYDISSAPELYTMPERLRAYRVIIAAIKIGDKWVAFGPGAVELSIKAAQMAADDL